MDPLKYSDISPRTTAFADQRFLKRAQPNNILGQFGQKRPMPRNKSQTIKFRRYEKLAPATTPLAEGVTPNGSKPTYTDVTATLQQHGDYVMITDVIRDTHEDPVLQEFSDILGEQGGETIDTLRFGVLKAGTNVLYANGTARTDVNTVPDRNMFRTATRVLKGQHARRISQIIKAGKNINTYPVPAAFFAVCHSDVQPDLERCDGWKGIEEYARTTNLVNGEIGAIGEIRFVIDNNCAPWADAGGNKANGSYTCLSTSGTKADVYPILVFGQEAYGLVPLGGKHSVRTLVNNPKASDSDPLAQRGTVGWKAWHCTVILNDNWMIRLEVGAKG